MNEWCIYIALYSNSSETSKQWPSFQNSHHCSSSYGKYQWKMTTMENAEDSSGIQNTHKWLSNLLGEFVFSIDSKVEKFGIQCSRYIWCWMYKKEHHTCCAVKPGVGRLCSFRVWVTCSNYGKHGSALYQKILKENVLSSVCKLKLEFKKVYSFAIWDEGTLQSSANSHLSLFCHPKSAPSILSQIRLGGLLWTWSLSLGPHTLSFICANI